MSENNVSLVFNSLKQCIPQTPYEIAKKTELNQRTVQTILLELAVNNKHIRLKKIGRYRLFWRDE